jgi:hypothetical protein
VAKKYLRMLTKDKNTSVAIVAKIAFAYRHFGKPNSEAEFLEGEDSTMQDQSTTDETDKLAGAWQLLLPLTTGGKADPKSKARKWYSGRGFDSKEQCEVGIQVMQQFSDDRAPLHGECVPAPPR